VDGDGWADQGQKRVVSLGISGFPRKCQVRGSGRGGLPAVLESHAYRTGTVEGGEVRWPVRCDARTVRQQFPGVFEDHDAVAEQAPALLGVADDGVRRFAIRI
jgi:hypothetical protein